MSELCGSPAWSKVRGLVRMLRIASVFFALCILALPQTLMPPHDGSYQKGKTTMNHASGTFEVKLTPLAAEGAIKEANLVRMSLNKQFSGDLTATSKGEMVADGMAEKGSGGYVAMERVTGKLGGRQGSFALQHSGTMTGGVAHLSVTVVPGSGTEQLAGLSGKMTIRIEGGKHYYDFEFTITNTSTGSN